MTVSEIGRLSSENVFEREPREITLILHSFGRDFNTD